MRQRYEPYLLMAATRYRIGRESYGSVVVADELVKAARWLNDTDKQIIARDLREGMLWSSSTDAPHWQRALAALEARDA